jgi:hypothetical protein
MTDSRQHRTTRTERVQVAAIVLALALGLVGSALMASVAHAATPKRYWGTVADGALTWVAPPDGAATIGAGSSTTLPRCATEVDVWTVTRGGQSYYRLRQGIDRVGLRHHVRQYGFETARHRVLAGYVPVNREVFNFRSRGNVRAYWWCD